MKQGNFKKQVGQLGTNFAFGLLLGALLVGCAGFSYRYYGLDVPSYEGKLLGPKPELDKPFSVCKPDDVMKGKCVVMIQDEFFRMKQDYEETKRMLKDCQANR
jgi:hypothetical protein